METRMASETINKPPIIHLQGNLDANLKESVIYESIQSKKLGFLLKRLFDIIVSVFLILLFSPILIVVSLIIKLTSKGPLLYSNERVGQNENHFRCLKFRSMVSDQSVKEVDHKIALEGQAKGILHKQKNDSRVTWIGKLIRKSSIDELPQLFNVLMGDMSIVGPRPLVPFMLTPYPEFKKIRCFVRPGITGLWQIRDRENNTSAEFMIEHDTEYIENFSLLLDLKILVSTPFVVLSAKGAY